MKQAANEQELIEQTKLGQTDAFRKLFEYYKTPVYNFVVRMIDQPQDAEDVVQEVFVKMYQKLSTLRDSRYFSSWLFRIAKNEAINYSHKHRRWPFDSIDDFNNSQIATLRTDEEAYEKNPQRKVEKDEFERLVQNALNEMPKHYRAAFILGVIEGYSYKEVAEILGCSVNNIKARVFRARVVLSQKLSPYLSEKF